MGSEYERFRLHQIINKKDHEYLLDYVERTQRPSKIFNDWLAESKLRVTEKEEPKKPKDKNES